MIKSQIFIYITPSKQLQSLQRIFTGPAFPFSSLIDSPSSIPNISLQQFILLHISVTRAIELVHPIQFYIYNDCRADVGTFRQSYVSLLSCQLYSPAKLPNTYALCLMDYGVAPVSRIDQIIGLFCKRAL